MKKKLTIILILLSMVVNFFAFPQIINADDEYETTSCSFLEVGGSCIDSNGNSYNVEESRCPSGTCTLYINKTTGAYSLTKPSSNTDEGEDEEGSYKLDKSHYYTDDASCDMRIYADGTKKPVRCYKLGPNGERTAEEIPIDSVNIDELQYIRLEKFQSKDGTNFYPLAVDAEKIFNFSIAEGDLLKPVDWLFDKNTYIVIKEVDGEKAVYWNVPNVQQQVVNTVIDKLSTNTGYVDNTYTPKTNLVPVGTDRNNMTRYGFDIPSYTYNGEISLVLMSMNRILPTNFWSAAWRALKATFGGSFINAPDAENYASMQYIGNDYDDNTENLIDFIANNWDEFFVDKIYRAVDETTVNGYSDYKCTSGESTFCDFVTLNESKDFKEQGQKLAHSLNYYYNGTITQMYVAPSAMENARQWIENFFFRIQLKESGNYAFTTEEITSKTNEFGHAEHGYSYNAEKMSLEKHEIGVEDIKTFDEQIQKVIAYDKEQAMIIATNRCKIGYNTTDKDITEKSDGVKDIEPTDSTDSACATSNGGSSEYCYEYEDTKTTYDPCTLTSDSSACCVGGNCYSNFGCNAAGGCSVINTEKIKVWKFDSESYENDHNYWENKEGTPTGKYKGKDKDINNVKDCVEQYDKLYDKCVDHISRENLTEEQKICPIYEEHKYKVPTYTYSKTDKKLMYGGSSKDYSYATNDREKWFQSSHYMYRFGSDQPNSGKFMNYNSTYPTSTSLNFNQGYSSIKMFNSDEESRLIANKPETNLFPSAEIIEKIVGIDTHNTVKGAYAGNVETVAKYRLYTLHWEESFKQSKKSGNKDKFFYNQCLISTATTNQCLTEDGNQLYLKNIFADNGVAEIEMDVNSKKWQVEKEKLEEKNKIKIKDEDLKRQKAELIVSKIQAASAQYYDQVVNNLVQLMITKSDGKIKFEDNLPIRVIPYNVDSMILEDQERVGIADPRYTNSILSSIMNGEFPTIRLNVIQPIAEKFLSFIGKISEIAVMLSQFMTFEFVENVLHLSPEDMWENAFIMIAISVLVVWFIVRMVILAYKFVKGNAGLKEVITRFILFLFMLSVLTILSIAPDRVWNTVKRATTVMTAAGERASLQSNKVYDFIIQDNNSNDEVYWAVYFDAWSLYNTGYSLTTINAQTKENPQLVKLGDGTPETAGNFDNKGVWSLNLADSFLYDAGKNNINIDSRAYRVVDHFMAPRVTINDNNTISVKPNENFNDMYQKNVLGLIPKAAGALLITTLVLIKFLTFLYFWYLLYMFVLNIMLSLNTEKDLKELFKITFMPILQLFALGLWTSIVIYVTSITNDLAGIIIILAFYYISWRLFTLWKERFGYFPQTLLPLYLLPKALIRTYNNVRGLFRE